MKKPLISVIIPTYHDWQRLRACLNALKLQTLSYDKFEIIVINNDHNDLVPPDINGKNLTVLSQPIKGSYAARKLLI